MCDYPFHAFVFLFAYRFEPVCTCRAILRLRKMYMGKRIMKWVMSILSMTTKRLCLWIRLLPKGSGLWFQAFEQNELLDWRGRLGCVSVAWLPWVSIYSVVAGFPHSSSAHFFKMTVFSNSCYALFGNERLRQKARSTFKDHDPSNKSCVL